MKFSMFSAFFKACSLSRTSLLYRMPSSLSTTFFNFFRSVFLSISMRAIASFFVVFCCLRLSDSLIILPKILPLVNGFLHLFLPFFDFFFTRVLRAFSRPETSSTRPLANTCFGVFAGGVQGTAEQGKARAEQKTIMYEKRFTRLQSLQKYGYLHTPHTCPEFL